MPLAFTHLLPSVRNRVKPSLGAEDEDDDELLLTTELDELELVSLLAELELPPEDDPPPQATKPRILTDVMRLSALSRRPRVAMLCMVDTPLLSLFRRKYFSIDAETPAPECTYSNSNS